jgi:hypothetical protein
VTLALGALLTAPASSIDLDDPNSVSPGILGFIAFFLLAVALYLLVRNMNGHLRRVRYRQEALEAEEAQAAEQARPAEPPGDAPEGERPNGKQPNGTTPTS